MLLHQGSAHTAPCPSIPEEQLMRSKDGSQNIARRSSTCFQEADKIIWSHVVQLMARRRSQTMRSFANDHRIPMQEEQVQDPRLPTAQLSSGCHQLPHHTAMTSNYGILKWREATRVLATYLCSRLQQQGNNICFATSGCRVHWRVQVVVVVLACDRKVDIDWMLQQVLYHFLLAHIARLPHQVRIVACLPREIGFVRNQEFQKIQSLVAHCCMARWEHALHVLNACKECVLGVWGPFGLQKKLRHLQIPAQHRYGNGRAHGKVFPREAEGAKGSVGVG
mmetsp:Transcript_12237/g.28530  ORF Transcript_12237/g.28530 Transcript_12237/m.28530 type:complete len:279 (-) Transcript_12237:1207-2043(-)